MSEFSPVSTVVEFRQLDDGEVLDGYFGGFHGEAYPGSDRSKSYWHGWRTGRIDSGRVIADAGDKLLAEEFQRLDRLN